MKDDWRLLRGQLNYLYGSTLIHHNYKSSSKTNDHDHCEFCMQKFGFGAADLHIGYSTEDNDIWICEKCYKDFNKLFNWNVV